ncbi:hypothetical protein PC39_03702 [Salinisphaera sp. PC39]|uniref:DUF6763 family protein n=1 Tax=Salinisphaera sp. PC39 TaxID=1304156 RepID=UPI003342BA3C
MGRSLREIEIGDWFEDLETGERFEVVAFDQAGGTIEVQYFDGTVEEFDFDAWTQMPLAESAQPEDWSGAFDADREDLDADWLHGQDGDPVDEIERLLY